MSSKQQWEAQCSINSGIIPSHSEIFIYFLITSLFHNYRKVVNRGFCARNFPATHTVSFKCSDMNGCSSSGLLLKQPTSPKPNSQQTQKLIKCTKQNAKCNFPFLCLRTHYFIQIKSLEVGFEYRMLM